VGKYAKAKSLRLGQAAAAAITSLNK